MVIMLERVNAFIWGIPVLVLILIVGLRLTAATGAVQLRLLPAAIGELFKKFRRSVPTGDSVSGFQSLCTALAATVGTGNIAGVAGAIAIGGPGAVFWMWICALIGMATKFAEAVLAVHYRQRTERCGYCGGPMYYILFGMGRRWRWLAVTYCVLGAVAALGVGGATQINAVVSGAGDVLTAIGLQNGLAARLCIGFTLVALASLILFGGAKRVGNCAELLVPIAAGGYILLCIGALLYQRNRLPYALHLILKGAISPKAITGGAVGSFFIALRTGVSRGVFTNEAGMGTGGIAHACAAVEHPVQQGLMGIIEVFMDTLVICTLTALVILTGCTDITYATDTGVLLTIRAFAGTYGQWVNIPIALFLCVFAFATMIGWGLYGLRCIQFVFGNRAGNLFVFLLAAASLGSILLETSAVWLVAEILNAFMAVPNLIALSALTPVLLELVTEYKKRAPKGALKGAKCQARGTETDTPSAS